MSSDLPQLCDKWTALLAGDSPDSRRPSRQFVSIDRHSHTCCVGCRAIKEANRRVDAQPKYGVGVFLRRLGETLFISYSEAWRGDCVFRSVVLCAPDDVAPNPWNLKGRLPSEESTGSESAMRLARDWLAACVGAHSSCNSPAMPPLPTRVLDVGLGPSSPIVLREAGGDHGRYICLSYCWGKADFLRTTRTTLERHKQGIGFADLPQTFRDAVTIARNLRVQYLWIDALCIIQDDEDGTDWKREAGRMANVYRDSYLTVVATWADSAHGGCFVCPEPAVVVGPAKVREFLHFPTATNLAESDHFPALARAWTYQERLLPRRVLYYGRQELLWECRESQVCECGEMEVMSGGIKKPYLYRLMSESSAVDPNKPNLAAQRLWRFMVEQYSSMQLSYSVDKLPALSGLADEIQRIRKQEYLAGLWWDTLVLDMCWHLAYPSESLEPWPPVDRAPTWSWASLDGEVTYSEDLVFGMGNDPDVEYYAEVSSAKIFLAGPSFTGQVRGGFVELRCRVIPVRLGLGSSGYPVVSFGSTELTFMSDQRVGVKEEGGKETLLIPMTLLNGEVLYGIVVTPAEHRPGQMIRIGLAAAAKCNIEAQIFQQITREGNQQVRIV